MPVVLRGFTLFFPHTYKGPGTSTTWKGNGRRAAAVPHTLATTKSRVTVVTDLHAQLWCQCHSRQIHIRSLWFFIGDNPYKASLLNIFRQAIREPSIRCCGKGLRPMTPRCAQYYLSLGHGALASKSKASKLVWLMVTWEPNTRCCGRGLRPMYLSFGHGAMTSRYLNLWKNADPRVR